MFNYERIINIQQEENELINDLIYYDNANSAKNLFFRFLDLAEKISEKDKALSILLNNVIERKKNYQIEIGHKIIEAILINTHHLDKMFNINEMLKKSILVLHETRTINYKSLYKIFNLLNRQKERYLDVINYIIERYFSITALPTNAQTKYLKTRGDLFRYTVEFKKYDLMEYAKEIKRVKSRSMHSIENQIQRLVEAKKTQHESLPIIEYTKFSNAVINKHFKFFDREDNANFSRFLEQKLRTVNHAVNSRNVMHTPIKAEMFQQFERNSISMLNVFVIPCLDDYVSVGKKYSFYDIALGTALTYSSSRSHHDGNLTILLYSDEGIEPIYVTKDRNKRKKIVNEIIDKMITRKPPSRMNLPDIIDLLINENQIFANLIIFGHSDIINSMFFGQTCQKTRELLCMKRFRLHMKSKFDQSEGLNVILSTFNSTSKYLNNFSIDKLFKDIYFMRGFSTSRMNSLSQGYISDITESQMFENYTNYHRNGSLRGILL